MLLVLVLYLDFENLYLLNIIASYNKTLHASSCGTKRKLTNKKSVTLWHKQLGHASSLNWCIALIT